MNNSLATLTDTIPYVKGLRKYAGSVTATILMRQLDYWFRHSPDGFYKFLEPCENAAYKEGDSWTEELDFSPDEFRTAFDKIGTRHHSKKAFDAALDKFQGKYYASYHDKIRNLTYYFRNHGLVDAVLDEIARETPPKAKLRKRTIPSYVNGQSQATELGNGNLQYTETTTETTSKTTEIASNDAAVLAKGQISSVKQAIAHYSTLFKQKFGKSPNVQEGKDGKLLKTLIGRYGLEQVLTLLEKYLNSSDKFVVGSGYSLGVFCFRLNSLIVSEANSPPPRAATITDEEREATRRRRLERESKIIQQGATA